jgi:hypothetical protein
LSRNIAESKKNISYTFHHLNIFKICFKVSLTVLISFEKGGSVERGLEVNLISALDSNVMSALSLFLEGALLGAAVCFLFYLVLEFIYNQYNFKLKDEGP